MPHDIHDSQGIFKGLKVLLPRRGRSPYSWRCDCDLLYNNGASLPRDPQMVTYDIAIVQAPSRKPIKNFLYKLNPKLYTSTVPGEDTVASWDLDQVLRHYAQGSSQIPVLQHYWIDDCLRLGRMLGEEEDWGGWRVKATRDPRLIKPTSSETAARDAYEARRASVASKITSPSDQRPSLKRHRSDSPPRSPRHVSPPSRETIATDRLANKPAASSSRPNGFTAPPALRRNRSLLPRLDTIPTQGPTPPATPSIVNSLHPSLLGMEVSMASTERLVPTHTLRHATTPSSPSWSTPPSWAAPSKGMVLKTLSGTSQYCNQGGTQAGPSPHVSEHATTEMATTENVGDLTAWHITHTKPEITKAKIEQETFSTRTPAPTASPEYEVKDEINNEKGCRDGASTPSDADHDNGSLFGSPAPSPTKAETHQLDLDSASVVMGDSATFHSSSSPKLEVSVLVHRALPQIFALGPNRIPIHVINAPGCPFLQAAIASGGGSIMELCWAQYVIVAPGTTAESMIAFAAQRNVCARLVHSRWITDSMVAASLLDPARYEVRPSERARLLRGEWC